ncbi:MAG: hypothetical protein V4598_00780 [Bdellovibrionota bacterium]
MKANKKTLALGLLSCFSAEATTLNGYETSFYGFIKASSMYSSEALATYNNINLSAPTHAPAQTRAQEKVSRMSFQTQQSRAGVTMKKGEDLLARLEFDFIDFAKSSPTTQMVPRVRIASITYKQGNTKYIIGQDWDLFSPVTSFTFDFVGLYFLAGNSGFQRQQAQVIHTAGNWEWGAALGMAGNNPGTIDNDLETGKGPSYSGRVSYALNNGRIGLSGIYSQLKYTSNLTRHEAYGLNFFFEKTWGGTTVKSEAYYGKNLANLGALTIGKGTDSIDAREFGGTFTLQHKLSEKNIIFGGAGVAKADNKTEYAPFAINATNTITAPGIQRNFVSRVGFERKISEDFSWVSEVSRYETNSKLTGRYQLNTVSGFESGFILKF